MKKNVIVLPNKFGDQIEYPIDSEKAAAALAHERGTISLLLERLEKVSNE